MGVSIAPRPADCARHGGLDSRGGQARVNRGRCRGANRNGPSSIFIYRLAIWQSGSACRRIEGIPIWRQTGSIPGNGARASFSTRRNSSSMGSAAQTYRYSRTRFAFQLLLFRPLLIRRSAGFYAFSYDGHEPTTAGQNPSPSSRAEAGGASCFLYPKADSEGYKPTASRFDHLPQLIFCRIWGP